MLTKWFGTSASGSSKSDRFFRPQLEYLEGRLAPSSVVPMDSHGNGNGNGHGNGNGGGPPGHSNVHNMNNTHYNIHITGSFNGNVDSFNNVVAVAGTGAVGPGQVGAIGALFNLSGLVAAETSSSQLGMLIDDEIALAVDTYLSSTLGLNITGLDNAMTILNTDIHNNPLESTLVGQVVGSLAFDVTMDALTMAQPTI